MGKDRNTKTLWLLGILLSLLAIFAFYCTHTPQAPKTVMATISNLEPRRDVTGQIINAHRGCLQFFNGTFYLYGTAFGTNQDALAKGLTFAVYSSPDLQTWTYEGKLLKDPPAGFYSRAFIVFNPTLRKYVAWYSWFPTLWNGQAGIAVSDTPTGPFVVVQPKAHLVGKDPGDGSLFVDDDGTGYYIYTDMADDYALRVEQLTPDFLDTDGKNISILAKGMEAPVLFRRENIYYAMAGPLCPDCSQGSELQVFTSDSPLGPYSTTVSSNINHRDINPTASSPAADGTSTNPPANTTFGKFTATIDPDTSRPNLPVQETWVLKLPGGNGSDYIWIADRWGSAPDGVSAHDLQYWSPLHFSDDGQILPLKVVPLWNISFPSVE